MQKMFSIHPVLLRVTVDTPRMNVPSFKCGIIRRVKKPGGLQAHFCLSGISLCDHLRLGIYLLKSVLRVEVRSFPLKQSSEARNILLIVFKKYILHTKK